MVYNKVMLAVILKAPNAFQGNTNCKVCTAFVIKSVNLIQDDHPLQSVSHFEKNTFGQNETLFFDLKQGLLTMKQQLST